MAGHESWGADAETMDEIRPGPGYECKRLSCPKCGRAVGDLPQYIRACTGGEDA